MRIGFDAFPIFHLTNGIGRHTYNLLKHLLELHEDLDIFGYVPKGAKFGPEQLKFNDCPRLTWVELEKVSRWHSPKVSKLDLFHGTNYKMYYQGKFGGVVTIHDVFLDRHPEFSKKLFGQKLSFLRVKRTIKKARRVITVSSHAAQEICELYDVPEDRIVVIPNGVSREFGKCSTAECWPLLKSQLGITSEQYILFLGGSTPRKNHQLLFSAFSQCASLHDTHSLVCVGKSEDQFGSIHKSAMEYGIEAHVVCLEKVSFETLKVLYSTASAFVVPSFYEGFGIPVLEAMASGTPVIASNATALPEVAGDAALLVNPNNPRELAEAILKIVDNAHLRNDLIEKGRQRSNMFSWQSAASRTYEVYVQLCE